MNKQTLYFAIYVNVGGMSPMRIKETMAQVINMYGPGRMSPLQSQHNQYEEKMFFFPVKNGDTRMELLFPSPFLTEKQAEELYGKYYEKFNKLIEEIKGL